MGYTLIMHDGTRTSTRGRRSGWVITAPSSDCVRRSFYRILGSLGCERLVSVLTVTNFMRRRRGIRSNGTGWTELRVAG